MATTKGFIKLGNNRILPITRAELVLDAQGKMAFTSELFAAGGDNAYGLISAAERALLQTGVSGSGQSIADIYAKLGKINSGLVFNETAVKFYNEATGEATPIKINASEGIALGVADNVISIKLTEVGEQNVASSILRGITVDKYGRVTAVEHGALNNNDIPATLSSKKLDGCTTDTVAAADNAIVNKKYVDEKFASVTGIASGGLQFKGVIDSADSASSYLNASYLNSFFKITGDGFQIDAANLYKSDAPVFTKAGDTVIVYKDEQGTPKFVHIPSADETTLVTVKGYNNGAANTAIDSRDGHIELNFSDVFNVTGRGTSATVTLPAVSMDSDGYLSKQDYAEFKGYSNSLKVDYTGKFSEGAGVYEIGTLTLGASSKTLYGKDTTYGLELIDGVGENTEYNPILKWSSNGSAVSQFTFTGSNGIVVKKSANAIEFSANNAVATGSENYLDIKGSTFGVKLGSINSAGEITEGLVSFTALSNFANQVHQSFIRYEDIENSLTDTSKAMHYGSTDLISAITVTI